MLKEKLRKFLEKEIFRTKSGINLPPIKIFMWKFVGTCILQAKHDIVIFA
jgi:hypothetical protein